MREKSKLDSLEIGTVKGNNNINITKVFNLLSHAELLTEQSNNLISSIDSQLEEFERTPSRVSFSHIILIIFTFFFFALLITPAFLYFINTPIHDIQSITFLIASSLSGIVGIVGVILGRKISSIR